MSDNQCQWLWLNLYPNRGDLCPHRVPIKGDLDQVAAETWVIIECKGFFFCEGEAFYFSEEDAAFHFRMRWT